VTVTDFEGLSASTSMEIEVIPDDEKIIENDYETENGFLIPFIIISIILIISIAIVCGIFLFLRGKKKKDIEKREAEISRFRRAPPLPGQYVKGDSPFMIQRFQSPPEKEKGRDKLEKLNPPENDQRNSTQ
jgi:hypothetical protein